MSSNLVESTGEGSNRKRSPSPINIRKYLVKPSVSSPTHTTTTAKQPLTSPDENVMKNQQTTPPAEKITTTTTTMSKSTTEDKPELTEKSFTKKPAVSTKVQSRIVDLIGKTKKSASPLARPSLKRSYSATTMLDNVDKSWMSSTKKKLDDSTEAVSLFLFAVHINLVQLNLIFTLFLVRPSYTQYIRYGICSSYYGFTRN